MTFLALVLNRPMRRMCPVRPASPRASIAAGVAAAGNRVALARFTLLSVAWADSITATRSWNGDW